MDSNHLHDPSSSGEIELNREVERIANLMLHDNVSADEQDIDKLAPYVRQVDLAACNISESDKDRDAKVRNIVYESLLYRKMKISNHDESILDRGSKFGAGFS